MNIMHVRYFIAAVEKGSYAAASSSCYVTVQTISKAVATLEREMNAKLLIRSSTGVKLTEFGQLFYEKALRADEQFNELEHAGEVQRKTEEPQILAIAVSHELSHSSIIENEDLNAFACRHPSIDFVIHSSSSAECVRAVEAHTMDAALVMSHVASPTLEVSTIAHRAPALMMNASHPLAKRERVNIEDLRDVSIATPPDLVDSYAPLMRTCRNEGFSPSFADIEPALEAHRAFMRDALGVILVIDSAWVRETYPECVVRPIGPYPHASVPLSFAFDPLRATPALYAFRRYVMQIVHDIERKRT